MTDLREGAQTRSKTQGTVRGCRFALAVALSLSLAAAPLAAFGVSDETAGEGAAAQVESAEAAASADAASAASSSTAAGASQSGEAGSKATSYTGVLTADGEEVAAEGEELASTEAGKSAVLAQNAGSALLNGCTLSTQAANAPSLVAAQGGAIVGNALNVATQADGSPAAVARMGGGFSLANSTLTTAGGASPLLASAGVIEADNVIGKAANPQLVAIEDGGSVVMAGSSLSIAEAPAANEGSSAAAPSAASAAATTAASAAATTAASAAATALSTAFDPANSAILLYRTTSEDANTTARMSSGVLPTGASAAATTALFQASGCSLESNLQTGAFFYLTNTMANIVLADTSLSFDTDAAKLLVAAGNNASGWGASGKNGATATLTAVDQQLKGDIQVDAISTLDLYLLNGSTWSGASEVTKNSAGTALTNNITLNIDSTSGWTVAGDSTVSYLNIEKGGALVDKDGKAVMIVDKDGNKLVDGASDIKVTVTGEFSTTVKTRDDNQLRGATIDRAAFDERFGTQTTFGTNGDDAVTSDEMRAEKLRHIVVNWFASL